MGSIALRVQAMQDELNLTDAELARRLSISKATVGKWKNHGAIPRGDTLTLIRELFGINDVWLVHGKGPMKVQPTMDEFTAAVASLSRGLSDDVKEQILDFARYKAQKNAGR